jgi:hypothetical protein
MHKRPAMKKVLLKAKKKIAIFLLPWIATIITVFPYNEQASRFLDRLILISEAE